LQAARSEVSLPNKEKARADLFGCGERFYNRSQNTQIELLRPAQFEKQAALEWLGRTFGKSGERSPAASHYCLKHRCAV
jgi:hypothetical protein